MSNIAKVHVPIILNRRFKRGNVGFICEPHFYYTFAHSPVERGNLLKSPLSQLILVHMAPRTLESHQSDACLDSRFFDASRTVPCGLTRWSRLVLFLFVFSSGTACFCFVSLNHSQVPIHRHCCDVEMMLMAMTKAS